MRPLMSLLPHRAKRDRETEARRDGTSGFGGDSETMKHWPKVNTRGFMEEERYSTNELMRRTLEEGAGFWRWIIRRIKDLI